MSVKKADIRHAYPPAQPLPPMRRRRSARDRLAARRRAMIAALLPTAVMMIGATASLSAKAAPRALDPYTDGARLVEQRDIFTEGSNATGTRDTFTDGARAPTPVDDRTTPRA